MFDLDGTLVDTAPDLAYAVNESLRQLNLPPQDEEKIKQWVGSGAETLLRMALTGSADGYVEPDLMRRSLEFFGSSYMSNLTRASRPFPGALQCLEQLRRRGIDVACITNKYSAFTEPLLQQLELEQMFSIVLSGDSLPRCKPAPDQLLHAMQFSGVMPTESWMVGDSSNDVQAARAAGVAALCVDYGYSAIAAEALAADVVLSRLDKMLDLL